MKNSSVTQVLLLMSVLFLSSSALAQEEGEILVDEARCYACHQINEASLGPSYQAIAARHNQRKEVMIDVLAGKIVRGGGGSWGLVPMVPNQRVDKEEAKVMAEWILNQVPP